MVIFQFATLNNQRVYSKTYRPLHTTAQPLPLLVIPPVLGMPYWVGMAHCGIVPLDGQGIYSSSLQYIYIYVDMYI